MDPDVGRGHPGRAVVQIDRQTVVFVMALKRQSPEQPARVRPDSGVEVMHLGGEVGEVELTSVEIQSDELKRPFVNRTVPANVVTTHEPHVRIEQKRLCGPVRIRSRSGALHLCDTDEALEIGDGGWVHSGAEGSQVERDPVDDKSVLCRPGGVIPKPARQRTRGPQHAGA